MESVFILIPISILLFFVIAGFFWWSSKNEQFDDLEGPAFRILMDDDDVHEATPITNNEPDTSETTSSDKTDQK